MRNTFLRLFVGLSLIAGAASAGEMTGWFSDSSCGAGNASSKAESRDCAERCINNGAEAVFVSEADQKVYKIANQDKVKGFIKSKVKVSGDVKDGKLTIQKVEAIQG